MNEHPRQLGGVFRPFPIGCIPSWCCCLCCLWWRFSLPCSTCFLC